MAYACDPQVVCPFYVGEGATRTYVIICEGTEDDNQTGIKCNSKDDVTSYKDRYCRRISRWHKCPLAIGLSSKW